MRTDTALRAVFVFFLLGSLVGCAHSNLKDEPADQYGPSMKIGALAALGWEIGAPTTFSEAEKSEFFVDNDGWQAFKHNFGTGDELRSIRNNAGVGFARFHKGKLVDHYFWAVF